MASQRFYTWEEAVSWLIDQPEHQELAKSCYYDQPHQIAADRYWQSTEWQAICKFLPEQPGNALDIGAGNGISSYALAKDGWQVTSLEPDPSDLVGVGAIHKLAEANHLPITVTQEFGENLPFPDANFDFVFARQVLHHAQDLSKLCSEIRRVLKPGGTFIAVRDHVISKPEDLPRFLAVHPLHKLYGGENAFLLSDYISAMQQAGLIVKRVIKPFDNVINYAPRSQDGLKTEFRQRFQRFPLGQIFADILLHDLCFPIFAQGISYFDHRPGRLYSFIARKPGARKL